MSGIKPGTDVIGALEVVVDEDDGTVMIVHPIFGEDTGFSMKPRTAFDLGMSLCSAAMLLNGGPFKAAQS